jgi:probable phosphoglycerate mutase
MSPLATLIFIRHGETDWNVEGRLQGQRDIPLNDTGRAQARRNGAALRAALPAAAGFSFVASPLSRSRETMALVRRELALPADGYAMDDRLKELSFGEWEGLTEDDVRQLTPALAAAREKDKWRFLPPGGESYAVLSDRVAAWLAGLGGPTLAVAHGGVGRVLRRMVLGLDALQAITTPFPQDRVLVLEDGRERWI